MPVISRFRGIAIVIYHRDHAPPHFHAFYGDYEMAVRILDGAVDGEFPRCARGLVLEWLEQYRGELLANWDRAQAGEALLPVQPLD